MSSAGVGPLCFFLKPTSLHPSSKYILEYFMLLSTDHLLKMLILFFSRIWHMHTLPKAPKVG